MAIDKGLYEAPEGMDDEMDMDDEVEITIVDPEMVTLDDGSVEITLIPDAMEDDLANAPFDANLAEFIDDDTLNALASELSELVEADIISRKDWADTFVKGMEVIGFNYEERTEPWADACGVYSNVLAEAAIRFQAETMSETFPAAGPVKTKILGEETKEKLDASLRVQEDMNYLLTEEMVEYRPEHERLLYSLGLAGSAFKKVYFDPTLGRQTAVYLPAEDVIVPYGASHIESAERVTHIMRKTKNELRSLQLTGFYRDVDIGDPEPFHTDIEEKKAEEGGFTLNEDDRYALYEVHVTMHLEQCGLAEDDEDEIARPYVITIDRNSGEVLAIYRNWEEGDMLTKKRNHFVHYVYVPGFGFYGLGLIHIVGGYARAGTSIIRQLVDAGTLSNLPGGMKTRGMRVRGDDTPIAPGEWRDVDLPSGTLRDNFMPLPYKEPSQTLLALLERITNEGRRLAAISDINVSDMSAQAPVGTTLALLERALKPMTAVQARVHYAMKQEFKLLKAIIAANAPDDYTYIPQRGAETARKVDYAMVDVIPVSDPNSSTLAQRVVQYQAVLQMAQQAPQIYDLPMLHRQMLEVLGVKNADKLIPMASDTAPTDPVSENMAAINGKPMKAYIYQDHEAHMAAHTAFMQDPMIAQTIGQNPQANQIMAALQAHIAEHLAFAYRKQIEERLGVTLPPPGQELPEDVEVQLSRLVADAGKQLTDAHKQQAAQQQAQQQAQDPVLQLKQQEVQTKQMEVQRKAEKDRADLQLRAEEQRRKAEKDRLDAMAKAQSVEIDKADLTLKARREGEQLSLDKAKFDTQVQADLFKHTTTQRQKPRKE